jgi:hypothetical protein
MAELRRGHVVDGRAELRVVEDVEKIGARLQRKALAKPGPPLQGEIGLGSVEVAKGIGERSPWPATGMPKAFGLMALPPG